MNILFISRNSPFESIGGIERYISNLVNYYKDGDKSHLYLMLPTDKEDYTTKEGDVTIHYLNSLFLSRSNIPSKKDISLKAQTFAQNLQDVIKSEKIDIICAENFHTDLPAAYSLLLTMVTMTYKIPLVLQLHSFAMTELQTELINQLKWDAITCVSKSVAGDCFQKGTDINYISTHYLGVDTKLFNKNVKPEFDLKSDLGLNEENKIILTATRIIRGKKDILQQKGVIDLIQAFSKIAPRYKNLRLLIAIGKPPENLKNEFNIAYEMLQGYIKLHNIEEQTILKTFKLKEMPSVYKGSNIFILPSENETFGQVFIEAMASGLPVIGTKVGGIPEIISDSYNGFLVLPNDPSIIAQRIETLLNDASLRTKFINAGIKNVELNFTATKQFYNFHQMLDKLVNNKISNDIN